MKACSDPTCPHPFCEGAEDYRHRRRLQGEKRRFDPTRLGIDLSPLSPDELRRLRTEMGLTQKEMAPLLGLHRDYLATCESGRGLTEGATAALARIVHARALALCPFCGSGERMTVNGDDSDDYYAIGYWTICQQCACEGPAADTEEEAVSLWSTRK